MTQTNKLKIEIDDKNWESKRERLIGEPDEVIAHAEWTTPCDQQGWVYGGKIICRGEQVEHIDGLPAANFRSSEYVDVKPHEHAHAADLVWAESQCSCGSTVAMPRDEAPNPYSEEVLAALNVQGRIDDIEGKMEYLINVIEQLLVKLNAG